jgi:phage terminase Nu1 subunit (DNA packaging protein)
MPLLKRPVVEPPISKPLYLTRAAFARRVGVTREAIYKAIKRGDIQTSRRKGTIVIDWNSEGQKYIDLSPHPLRDHGRTYEAPPRDRANGNGYDPEAEEEVVDEGMEEYLKDKYSLTKSREVQEKFKAKKLELDYKQRAGELIEIAVVAKDWADIGSLIRRAVTAMPDRMTPIVNGLTEEHDIHQALQTECDTILEDLADAIEQREAHNASFGNGGGDTSA